MKANTLFAALLAAGALTVSGVVQAQDASGGSATTGSSGIGQQAPMSSGDTAASSSMQTPGSGTTASGAQMPGSDTAASGAAQTQGMSATAGMQPDQMSEDDIRKLQQALQDEGHDLNVDGIWGPNTETALRDFQEQQGIDATGQLDQETIAALDVQLNGVAEAESTGATSTSPTTASPSGQSSQ